MILCIHHNGSYHAPGSSSGCPETSRNRISLSPPCTVASKTTNAYLIEVINRTDNEFAQACYHPQLVPIQTCDTCMVEINGQLVRACGTYVSDGTTVLIKLAKAIAGQRQGFGRISNLVLYGTVCDNNNGNCTIHNAESLLLSNRDRGVQTPPHSARKECIVVDHSDKKGT